jgi:hypothetical protein
LGGVRSKGQFARILQGFKSTKVLIGVESMELNSRRSRGVLGNTQRRLACG